MRTINYMKNILLYSAIFIAVFFMRGAGAIAASEEDCIIISSPDAAEFTKSLQNNIERMWGNIQVKILDYDSKEAGELVSKLGIKAVPYAIFTDKIRENARFFEMAKNGLIERKGGLYVLPPKVLMSQPLLFLEREKKPAQLDIFVMSQCPAGNDALQKIGDYLEKNPGAFSVKCHYIVTFRDFGIDGLHGPVEVRENINQLLAQKYYPEKFWKYLKAYRTSRDFKKAANEAGIDASFIMEHKDEGIKLLEEDFKLARGFDISASPTFLWENRVLALSIDGFMKAYGHRIY